VLVHVVVLVGPPVFPTIVFLSVGVHEVPLGSQLGHFVRVVILAVLKHLISTSISTTDVASEGSKVTLIVRVVDFAISRINCWEGRAVDNQIVVDVTIPALWLFKIGNTSPVAGHGASIVVAVGPTFIHFPIIRVIIHVPPV